ncbi:Protein kinase domain [Macleaya cordata]|uniref:Receptor-like serine/threonine-protein kinase n=1 Tax=Macleaya cordata TaxID=56857 RepID=A0A200Q0X7_MACCD|nr:Protein kinase domain [Macleaya cordata]
MNKSIFPNFFLSSFTLLLLIGFHNCSAQDNTTVTPTQFIRDPQTLTSSVQTVVWVANRDNPLKDSSGVLRIANDGNLVLQDGRGIILWTTNISSIPVNNSIAAILDSGNLVLRLVSDRTRILWQSFEHPSDTYLPTMKIGGNRRTGKNQQLTSWRSESDPSTGIFLAGMELIDIPQMVIWNGSQRLWRSGPWNGRVFIGIPNMDSVYLNGFYSTRDDEEGSVYIAFKYANNSTVPRYVLDQQGVIFGEFWDEEGNEWYRTWSTADNGECVYGKCGPFGSCNKLESPICSCLRGFTPKSIDEWSKGNWSSGCVRKTELMGCERNSSILSNSNRNTSNHGFLKLETMKVPDFSYWLGAPDINDCEQECSMNCSCLAYSYDIGVGCMTWGGSLVDIQNFSQGGVDLYIRLARSEIDLDPNEQKNLNHDGKKKSQVIIVITVLVGTFIISVCTYFFWRWMTKQRGKRKKDMEISVDMDNVYEESAEQNMVGINPDLKIFKFEELAIATDNFSGGNKLGEGGFGSVYKVFMVGQEIAVKRLSKGSIQGLEEFKNEVLVILKLQHRNLVRLLGCCIEGEEKMLIYEYMPNKSLDAFLFDPTKSKLLDWTKRFQIIEGISRGILYLHRDSRLRVIHRDLKASNILLDEDLNPKISDFGMARIFGGNEQQANTGRVVGTYGYMSPEYLMEGQFSEKSDVFSFGVLLLEIVSGKKNNSFHYQELSLSLLGYAWQLWNENKIESLIDPTLLCESVFEVEILRCIHVGLLCVQEFSKDRPTMSTILSMLTSEIATLPSPNQPAFIERRINLSESNSLQKSQESCSINNLTITNVEGR